MSYPGWGFLVVLGVAIGSAIYYYFNNENNRYRYDYQRDGSSSGGREFRGDGNCTICLEKLSGIRQIRILPCGHTFHDHCIKMWLVQKKLCPNCRNTI